MSRRVNNEWHGKYKYTEMEQGGQENQEPLDAAAAREDGETVDSQHRAIRALLSSMSPRRAEAYIRAFQLREEETAVLIEGDIKGLSHVQIANKLHLSPETVKRRRQSAYRKIADDIEHSESREN